MPMDNKDVTYAAGWALFAILPACMTGTFFGFVAARTGTAVAPAAITGAIGGGAGLGWIWGYVTWDQTVGYFSEIREAISGIFEKTEQPENGPTLLPSATDSGYGSTQSVVIEISAPGSMESPNTSSNSRYRFSPPPGRRTGSENEESTPSNTISLTKELKI